jgi:hypothetical protein
MIGSLTDFDDATAFERWALEGLVPLPAARPHSAVKDIENNVVRVMPGTAIVRVYAGGAREVHVDLRPLAFGAAWKVLDLLVELALSQAGHGVVGRMTFAEKVRLAVHGQCPPLSSDAVLWEALTATYAATEEVRHSLVHRYAQVDRATGDLIGYDRSAQPLLPVKAANQESFCRAVQRSANAILANALSSRERCDLAWNLDQLAHLHGRPALGGQEMAPAPLGIARTRVSGDSVLVDVPSLLHQLRGNFPDRAAYDASFELPDGHHLLVELEQAPPGEVAIDPAALPPWAILWDGTE